MQIKSIGVMGAGGMGHGIAQVAAQAGISITLRDINEEFVQRGIRNIEQFMDQGIKRGKLTEEQKKETLARIKGVTDLTEAVEGVDLIIEAIVENLEEKKRFFRELDEICPANVIFASNTSYLSITELAAATKRPDRFIGMHWFNPPQIMRLIEVVRTPSTSEETVSAIVDFSKKVGKTPMVCRDSPGFVVNRILQPWYNEGMRLLEEGIATAQDIDTAIKLGGGFRMGPLELRDLVGLDIGLKGTLAIYEQLRDDKFRPPHCLIKKVQAGHYGRKTKRGFYEYQ
jgi:3-hydroxybutyryl-CoA dehydrogenase